MRDEKYMSRNFLKPDTKKNPGKNISLVGYGDALNAKHIMARTFGFFDFFVDGVVVVFSNRRAKELLAILVDNRGGMVPTSYILDVFWPEEPESEGNKSIVRKAFMSLKNTLEAYGIGHILISKRGQKAIVASELDCDYYRVREGCEETLSEYFGKYMIEYSWAEETNAWIHAIKEKIKD